MKAIEIYTDGACSGNPGPGGWGVVLLYQGNKKELAGYQPETTNNRMELFAAIQGLAALREPCEVTLYSDSSYLINAFEKHWLDNWQRNGWKTSSKSPVENQDLWKLLLLHVKNHRVRFVKVKGHSDNAYNNRCDEMAVAAIRNGRA
ncbi:MAG TPA: ribonuclease HI [Candidatus Spyradocola merdavium]|nr:ribonuclease HI [Candidatus Spyradocola merdavium]